MLNTETLTANRGRGEDEKEPEFSHVIEVTPLILI